MSPHSPVTSQRNAYQFPVYRWISWLTIGGFAAGLVLTFFVTGIFGLPAPFVWASAVILFTLGLMLLEHPKWLLGTMLFYFALMPSNRLLGLLGLPLPGFIDELFFLPFIAVIVMNWIQGRQISEGGLYPVLFIFLGVVSWYVNGRAGLFPAIQVTLILLKPYIIWYYCRLTCTFDDERQLTRWVWVVIVYAAVQFAYNCLWQQGPWVRFNADISGGVFGPRGRGGAHQVGYISIFALFLLAGWRSGISGQESRAWRRWAIVLSVIIGYDLVFMTDTKHALIFAPLAFLPFFFHSSISVRVRMGLIVASILFVLMSGIYFFQLTGTLQLQRYFLQMIHSPKGEVSHAVTTDFPHLVPYPLLGAGPGRFGSMQAVHAKVPLARRYILPYLADADRDKLAYTRTSRTGSSQLAWPQSDLLTLMGEFGWLGALLYYSFWGWVVWRLLQKSLMRSYSRMQRGLLLATACCLIFLAIVTVFIMVVTIPIVAFPLWMLAGRLWDMKPVGEKSLPAA